MYKKEFVDWNYQFNLNKAMSSSYSIIGIESSDVTPHKVQKLHEKGKKVHVYFTNNKTQKIEQKRIKEYQVDGYFTDYVQFTQALLQEHGER